MAQVGFWWKKLNFLRPSAEGSSTRFKAFKQQFWERIEFRTNFLHVCKYWLNKIMGKKEIDFGGLK